MGIKHLSSIPRRLKHGALALLFVATQVVFPLSLSGIVHAANPAANIDQCANGTVSSPTTCGTAWQNGDLNSTNSHYREGDSVPFRVAFSNLSTGSSNTFTFSWQTTKSGTHAYDYLTTFNRTEAATDPCNGIAGCGSPTTFAIPADPNVTGAGVTPVPGNFTLYNGTITAASAYSLSGTYSGDSTTSITLTFTAATSSPVLAWGGHVASQDDWGVGNSASNISGSPYHMATVNLDGSSTGSQDRAIKASAILPTPTLTTQTSSAAVNVGNSVTDTASLSGPNSPLAGTVTFFICSSASTTPDCTTGGTQVGTAKTVSPGTGTSGTATSDAYSVTAAGTYCFRAQFVPASNSPYSPFNETNQSTTAPNNECFVATIAPSTITIIKDAQPNSSQAFSYTTTGGLSTDTNGFNLVDSGSGTTNTQTFNNVGPGTYTVTELSQNGWDFKGIDCGGNSIAQINGATVTITITGGQSVVCTYTNAERGTLTVYKVTDPAGDTTGFPITASTTNGNISGSASQTVTTTTPVVYDVSQGTYNVSEDLSNLPGWAQLSNTCSSVVVSTSNLNASCTITNQKLAKLKIVKSTDPSSSSQSFSFSASGPSITAANNSFVLDTNNNDATYPNNYQYVNLTPGSYSVTEASTSGWKLTGLVCTGISYSWPGNTATLSLNLPAGADVTCTYTNTQLASISGTKYNVNADSSIVGPLQNWTIYLLVNGSVVNQTTTDVNGNYSFSGLLPGSYSLAEQTQNGWTQIYPFGNNIGINLTAGNNSTANNFGNFQNAEISGSKFNDVNGNGIWDNGEPGLSGWVITLYDNGGSGALLNHQVAQTTTATGGSYSFTNLPPTTYKLCETAQSGWTQTYPSANNGCQIVDVTLSGHNYSSTNFGNQGRGTLTVIKNVDSNGDGTVDFTDVTNWTWGYSGTNGNGSDIATGSTNAQAVAAGGYTVSENQKSGYHVTGSSCDNQSNANVSTSKTVTVNPGDNVVCTFTNTRDTGTITVNKTLVPSNDSGLFNLNIGSTTYATDVGNNGTTGAVSVVTGTYGVSEAAGTNTSLTDYSSTYQCTDNGTQVASGSGTSVSGLSVAFGDDVVCTFTNTRLATLTVTKDADPNSSQSFAFHFGSVVTNPSQLTGLVSDTPFSLVDDGSGQGNSQQFKDLNPGTYYVSEDTVTNWDLTNIQCTGVSFTTDPNNSAKISFTLAPGAVVNCTYTNTERGSIHGLKTIVNSNGSTASSQTGNSGVTINLYQGSSATGTPFETTTTDGSGDYSFTSLVPGTYTVSEVTPNGYTHISGGGTFTINPGQDVTANNTVDFGNFKNGSISGYKFNDLNGNGVFDQGEPKLSDWTIDIYTGSSANPLNLYDSTVTDSNGNYSFTNLPPNNYFVCEVGQTGWQQTSSPTCYSIDLNQSGEQDTAVFGNRGFGTITVIKNINDGFGNISQNVSGWTWDLTGTYYSNAGNPAGSTDTLSNLPADTYTIHEDQQTNYHFSSVACTDNGTPMTVVQAESTNVTLSAASNIVCTYTNTRDTGTVEVDKTINPSNDPGLFDLHINGATSYTATDQSNGGTTHAQTVVTGSYSASETAGTNTNLSDYSSTYECSNGLSGSGTSTPSFDVASGASIVCTFTNTRLATLTIVKQVESVNQADFSTPFSFTGSGNIGDFSLTDDNNTDNTRTFTDLPLGNYTVSEAHTSGWTLADLTCSDNSQQVASSYEALVNLPAGANVTCTFTNDKLATITVTKFNDLNRNGTYDSTTQTSGLSIPEPTLPGWDMTLNNENTQTATTQTTGTDGTTTFTNVPNGFYSLDETQQTGWNLSNIYCPNTEGGLDGAFFFGIPPGANISCFVGNYQNAVLQITKSNNRPNPTTVGDTVTYTIVVTVPQDSGAVFGTTVTDLPPANFIYVKGSWTANSTIRGDLKAADITGEPTYGSPGVWNLGNLLPGEVVTLTYQAIISQNVSDGTYPDIAFTQGFSTPDTSGTPDVIGGCTSACLSPLGDPFVGTRVSVVSSPIPGVFTAGQVLGAEVLVNTGTSLFWLEFVLPFILLGGVVGASWKKYGRGNQ